MFVTHDWLAGPIPKLKPTYAAVSENYIAKEKRIGDPTRLILVDEADRLKIACLEQMRVIFDADGNEGKPRRPQEHAERIAGYREGDSQRAENSARRCVARVWPGPHQTISF
jgi:hypothetical protein